MPACARLIKAIAVFFAKLDWLPAKKEGLRCGESFYLHETDAMTIRKLLKKQQHVKTHIKNKTINQAVRVFLLLAFGIKRQ
jgi:hypothetical protein